MSAQTIDETRSLTPLTEPFNNIGLAFSGGGFRAAAYSLGTLSYLHELPWQEGTLLQKVSYLSSASGGTITTAMYALNSAKGQPFALFYRKLFEQTTGVSLLQQVFKQLNSQVNWKPYRGKSRNIINAFSIVYNEALFEGETLADLANAVPGNHLQEVCFNATEFYRGLLFRQAVKMKPDTKPDVRFAFGNAIIHIRKEAALKLRLGDVLAASSCFPAGFEPIIFPADFANSGISRKELLAELRIEPQELKWEELRQLYTDEEIKARLNQNDSPPNLDELRKAFENLPVKKAFSAGFMDGGIADNQGIESIMQANDRRKKKETDFNEFDLMLINDVGSQYMDPYRPEKMEQHGGISIYILFGVAAAVLLASLFGVWYACQTKKTLGLITAMLSGAGILASLVIVVALLTVRRYISKENRRENGLNLNKNFSPEIVQDLFHYFGNTPIRVIASMVKARFNSVIALNNDVLLKRVRKLLYDKFLTEGRKTFRVKTNHIYDLSFSNDLNRRCFDDPDLHPLPNLQTVAQRAYEMGTTLWFDKRKGENYRQAAIIACGQFTTCYNLLLYIRRLKRDAVFNRFDTAVQQDVNVLEKRLEYDYAAFNTNPFWLYNRLGKEYQLTGFKEATMAAYPFPANFQKVR